MRLGRPDVVEPVSPGRARARPSARSQRLRDRGLGRCSRTPSMSAGAISVVDRQRCSKSGDRVALAATPRARPPAGRSPGRCASGPCGGRSAPRSGSGRRRPRPRSRPPRRPRRTRQHVVAVDLHAGHRVGRRPGRRARSTGVVEAIGEYSPYRLFSHTKITGSFQIEARLSASWNAPMLVEPSPKKHSDTDAGAAVPGRRTPVPQAIGRCAPTIANEPSAPTETSVRCIEPPLPPHRPLLLARGSRRTTRSSGAPIASTAPWPR